MFSDKSNKLKIYTYVKTKQINPKKYKSLCGPIHFNIYIYIYTLIYIYIYIYINTNTQIYTYIHICIHTYTHTYIYIYTYGHTHTHIYITSWSTHFYLVRIQDPRQSLRKRWRSKIHFSCQSFERVQTGQLKSDSRWTKLNNSKLFFVQNIKMVFNSRFILKKILFLLISHQRNLPYKKTKKQRMQEVNSEIFLRMNPQLNVILKKW